VASIAARRRAWSRHMDSNNESGEMQIALRQVELKPDTLLKVE